MKKTEEKYHAAYNGEASLRIYKKEGKIFFHLSNFRNGNIMVLTRSEALAVYNLLDKRAGDFTDNGAKILAKLFPKICAIKNGGILYLNCTNSREQGEMCNQLNRIKKSGDFSTMEYAVQDGKISVFIPFKGVFNMNEVIPMCWRLSEGEWIELPFLSDLELLSDMVDKSERPESVSKYIEIEAIKKGNNIGVQAVESPF